MVNFSTYPAPGIYVTAAENPQPLPSAGLGICYMLGTGTTGPQNTPTLITSVDNFSTIFGSSPSTPYVEQYLSIARGLYFINITAVSDPTAAEVATALSALSDEIDPGLLIAPELFTLPGRLDAVDVVSEMSQACSNRSLFAILDVPVGVSETVGADDSSGVRGYSEEVRADADVDPDLIALFFPYITIKGTDYAPSALIAANAINTWVTTVGSFAAGLAHPLPGDPNITLSLADREVLAPLSINPLMARSQGTIIYGVRALRVTSPWLISSQATINVLRVQLRHALEYLLFTPATTTGTVYNRAKLIAGPILDRYWRLGGLAGQTANDAYTIVCGPSNNNEEDVLSGNLLIEVMIRPTGAVEKVLIPLSITTA